MSQEHPASAPPVPEEAVRAELEHILDSPEFRASKRCQDFLAFVVDQTISGRADSLKERTIGVQAFGRETSYDTNADGIVRVKASEVRKRLGLYYAGTGKDDEVHIGLPVGGYTPTFGWHVPAELPPPPEPLVGPPVRSSLWRRFAVLALPVVLAVGWFALRKPPTVLDQFWKPVLTSQRPVLVAAAYVPVYVSSSETSSRQPAPGKEFVLLTDQFVGGGDLVATSCISGMLSRLAQPYEVKIGGVSFEDLRNSASILIGYSSERWANISQDLRYYIDDERGVITDKGKPTQWFPHNVNPDFHADEDYAIISRVFHPQTHQMMVQISGLLQYGTEAAAEVVVGQELLSEALRGAPPGWQRKNLQLVLHMKVVSNCPASPKVIASYYW